MEALESKKFRVIIELTTKSTGIVLKREIILKKKTKVNSFFQKRRFDQRQFFHDNLPQSLREQFQDFYRKRDKLTPASD